ncbi:hypothetical protein FNV43_RR05528 [Rhamnella rubrinervis]|uniref:Uncharacterized protein n=1 Tax=Rhamnella rubrinervis TaxID=2594499 RepID=A0A8K0HMB7_9ROSA|nr:hypothetical protein FNV43_RR05528 [Rhamnella rubrinervis]
MSVVTNPTMLCVSDAGIAIRVVGTSRGRRRGRGSTAGFPCFSCFGNHGDHRFDQVLKNLTFDLASLRWDPSLLLLLGFRRRRHLRGICSLSLRLSKFYMMMKMEIGETERDGDEGGKIKELVGVFWKIIKVLYDEEDEDEDEDGLLYKEAEKK